MTSKTVIEETARIKSADTPENSQTAIKALDQEVILSNQDRDLFLSLLNADIEPNEAITEAFSFYRSHPSINVLLS